MMAVENDEPFLGRKLVVQNQKKRLELGLRVLVVDFTMEVSETETSREDLGLFEKTTS